MAYKDILYDKGGNLAIITINRPKAMNSFTYETTYEMVDALEDAEKDGDVRAIILTGAGDRAFSAGADIQGLAATAQGERNIQSPEAMEMRVKGDKLCEFLYDLEKPTFAAVNGVVAGGALGFVLPCDIRIASDKARFSSIFVRRGLCPDFGSTWHLPRLLGASRALELMYTGDVIDAHEAERIGLVTRVVPHDKLMEVTKELAGRIAKGPPIALALTKREVRRAFQNTLAMQLDYENSCNTLCFQSEDFKEGVRSFLEKREPSFQGR